MSRARVLALMAAVGASLGAVGAHGRPPRSLVADAPYPGLRDVGELASPGGRAGVQGGGVYPSLRAPERLVFPGPAAIDYARRYTATRRGRVAFAVADTRGGVVGSAIDRPYRSASLIKAMLFVAYLQRLAHQRAGLSSADNFRLDAMIRVSDNDSASSIYKRLGPAAVLDVARRVGMRHFRIGAVWGDASVTAADQARFFLSMDRLLPGRYRAYGLHLLENIEPLQTWGVPSAARPRWHVYFKGGWRPDGGGQLVHQGALLEQGPRRLAIVVLSDGNPSERYGHQTIRGLAAHLLSRRPLPAASPRIHSGELVPLPALKHYRPPPEGRVRLEALRQSLSSGK